MQRLGLDSAAMRILVVGSGGVGAAFAPIAARRDFYEHIVFADIDEAKARTSSIASARAAGSPRPRVDATDATQVAGCARGERMRRDLERRRPAVRHAASSSGALEAGATYLDMAMSLSEPHPDAAARGDGQEARRRAVRGRRRVGGARAAGAGGMRRRARRRRRRSRGTPPTSCSARSTRSAFATARTSWSRGTRSRRRSRSGRRSRSA